MGNLLSEYVFSINMRPGRSFCTFGWIDYTTVAGRDIHWVDIDSRRGFWEFTSSYAKIGAERLKRSYSSAIADSGSSVIFTHPHIVWKIYTQIEGAAFDARQPGWVYPSEAKIPEIAFSVGGDERCMVVIGKEDMKHSELGAGFVYGAVQENPGYENGGHNFDIFGTPFLRQIYAIFDCKGPRFGVVKHNEGTVGEDGGDRSLSVESL
jgi:hypothetical protein